MKIMIVMEGFFPGKKYGGPPVSVDNFCSFMKNYNCYIVTKDHDLLESKRFSNIQEGWNDRENCKVLYLSDSKYKKITFEKVIDEITPDILYLQGVFQSCVFPCLQLARKHHIKVLLAPRGELCAGALNIKRYKKFLYIIILKAIGLVKNIHWQSTSNEETAAIKKWMKVDEAYIHSLDNIPSIMKRKYPRKEKVAGEGRFIFLSRIHPKKNLLSAIRYFQNLTGKAEFDIYGPIEDEVYWKKCQSEIKKLPKNIQVRYKGLVGHEQVHQVFSQYNAFLFPTLSENYGHVIAESLIAGTPVIISDQTPWRGLELAGGGWDINLSNEEKFREIIEKIIALNKLEYEYIHQRAIAYIEQKLNIQVLKKQYLSVFDKVLQR